ncbi:MAG: signal transduction histidine kinase [Verrucomicrobiales bacterium]|jgi:signal transduction histidine kinase
MSSKPHAAEHGFHAVVLDIMMPNVDGMEVLDELRKTYGSIDLPVIMATAKGETVDIVDALRRGANDYVIKPIDMPVLLARLDTQIALKRSHEALREAQRSLIEAAKMETVGMLAAGVAHEIRNPLAQILMASESLAGLDPVKKDEAGSVLAEILANADEIVKRLMEFSNSMKLSLEEGELNALVETTLEMLADDIAKPGIELDVKLASDLPPLRIATTELRQALLNVIGNAIQAMPQGGQLLVRTGIREVEGMPPDEGSRTGIRLRNVAEACFIEIEDTGPGIAQEDLDTIFDAFFTTRPTGTGQGLGLTVARKVVDLHGGLIRVENRTEATGVRVTILLPLTSSSSTV